MTKLFGGHLPQLMIFDLDGTLVDSVPDLAVATDRTLVAMGYKPAGEVRVRSWVGNGAAKLVCRALADALGVSETQVDPAHVEAGLSQFKQIYGEENGRLSRLYPGVDDVLVALQGINLSLAVVTNKPKEFADPLLVKLRIAQYFQQVIGGDCLLERKPHPLPLIHCCQQLGLKPEHCLMIGDSRNDVAAAKAAGMKSVALSYGYNHGEPVSASEPDWLLDDFRGLLL